MEIFDQYGNPLVIWGNNVAQKSTSTPSEEVRALKKRIAELEEQASQLNKELEAQKKMTKNHELLTKLSDRGLIIQDRVTGKWYENDDSDEAFVLRTLIEGGYNNEVSVESAMASYAKWIDSINNDSRYKDTANKVNKMTNRKQKLSTYLNSTYFTGSKEDT